MEMQMSIEISTPLYLFSLTRKYMLIRYFVLLPLYSLGFDCAANRSWEYKDINEPTRAKSRNQYLEILGQQQKDARSSGSLNVELNFSLKK